MTESDLRALMETYAGLVDKAKRIIAGAPYFTACAEEFGDLRIVGDNAVLYWPEWESGYYAGDGSIERQSLGFPLSLLLLSDDALSVWKDEQKFAYDARVAAEQANNATAAKMMREKQERQMYVALKAKFEAGGMKLEGE
jgi:hypothetical protein